MSKIEVNAVEPQCGTTLTIGASDTSIAGIGTVNWDTTKKTAAFTAVSGRGYFVDTTSGAVTMTLPASPSAGDIVAFKDYAQTFTTNNLTIGRNSSNLDGDAYDKIINTNSTSMTLVYVDATQGWKSVEEGTGYIGESFIVACGGTELTCGNFKTHVFTGPGSFTVSSLATCSSNNAVEYLVVAGGASGGRYIAGGGGAGGVRTFTALTPANPINAPAGLTVTATSFPITVGAGGAGAGPSGCSGPSTQACGNAGSNSIFSTITSAGGGGGGQCGSNGLSGGSGGGAGGRDPLSGGTGNTPPSSPPQGNDGGDCPNSPSNSAGGGGGGATTAGGIRCGSSVKLGGAGGTGAFLNDTFFGPTAPSYGQSPAPLAPNGRYFGGGGGGGGFDTPLAPTGNAINNGGAGGGGGGTTRGPSPGPSPLNLVGEAGDANTGGGGGVAGVSSGFGNQPGAGGSGIVVIRYRYQ